MCGIAGIVGAKAGLMRDRVERMVATLRHRGPDASGVLPFENAVLGHARLSIVDLSGGAQPLESAARDGGRIAVTFNGEIYGYRELRGGLHHAGYPFRTSGDTEVILALYARDGARLAEHLPGMFAFGLWDDGAQELFLARDRFGEKPLYWARYEQDGARGIVFASEIKAILASGLVRAGLDRDALAHYLQHLDVHPAQSIYENFHTLPPGHSMTYAAGEVRVRRYWDLPETRDDITAAEAAEELRHLFRQAVARQLVADVPVGAFLSGGLDSSTVVALAAALKPGLETFAFRFRGAVGEADEVEYAASVARMHGTRHRVLEDSDADIAGLLREMARVYDEPFADSSNIATFLISRLARQHLKVVLTGDGGDELLAGYPWYRELAGPFQGSVGAARLRQNQYFSDATLAKFGLAPPRLKQPIERSNTVDDALRMDLRDYMPGDILVKIDRAAMSHGLELRAPFLDVDLASFLIALPPRLKIDGRTDKLLLRQAFADLWPERVQKRGKQGFGAPVAEWLARPPVQDLVRTRLCDPRHPLFSLLPFDVTRIAVERQNFQAWSLLTLALWLEEHPL
jgi:asparagine synthase (glutamine-hydrolysing)